MQQKKRQKMNWQQIISIRWMKINTYIHHQDMNKFQLFPSFYLFTEQLHLSVLNLYIWHKLSPS